MLELQFINDVGAPFSAQDFQGLIQETQKRVEIEEDEVEFALIGDEAMQTINRESRGLDKPTDVLSFASREMEGPEVRWANRELNPSQEEDHVRLPKRSLGQIFISIPAAQRNADEMEQSLEEEVRFLFVHGLLHILGYDHQTTEEETEMMTLAYEILGRPPYQPD